MFRVPIGSSDTLPIVYEREYLFSKVKRRCHLMVVVAEVDQILSLEGKLIVHDKVEIINEVDKKFGGLAYKRSLPPSYVLRGAHAMKRATPIGSYLGALPFDPAAISIFPP